MVPDVFPNITAVCWKDNKSHECDSRLYWETTNSTGQTLVSSWKTESENWTTKDHKPIYMSMGWTDSMDQNISEYMIKLGIKKWWWPLFRFVVDVNVSNAYQIYRQSHFNPGEDRLDSLGFHQANVDAYYHL